MVAAIEIVLLTFEGVVFVVVGTVSFSFPSTFDVWELCLAIVFKS